MSAVARKRLRSAFNWIALTAERSRLHRQRFPRWLASFSSPPERWSRAHRLVAYVALTAIAFAAAEHGWRAAGIGASSTASRAALADIERRVEDARAALAQLPSMRENARKRGVPGETVPRSPAAQWQAISALAQRSGMTLRSLEPGTVVGDGIRKARPVRVVADGDFASFVGFVQALPTLPSLAVPFALQLERTNEGLAMDATLRVYDALPGDSFRQDPAGAGVETADDGPGWFADPFAIPGARAGTGADEIRLIGLIHANARARGIALLETADGASVYVPGQTIGTERIVSIDSRGVTLAGRGRLRVMTLAKEGVS